MQPTEETKSKIFIKKGAILWAIAIGAFILIKLFASTYGDLEQDQDGILHDLARTIFLFGICGIPIILLFSMGLRYAEKKINKLSDDEK